ncbi:Ig-like domain-containing protein, partial [Escherichia coli]|uniref:Ig-like domain-containing protein n=1 Tax=Escherichia coli TaxID=562 RepID=UPI001649B2A8
FVGDSSTAQVELQKSKNEVVADGNDSATMTATVRDAKGNLLNDVKVTFNVNSAEAKLSQTEVNSHDGIATATLTSLKNGDYRVTASVSSGSQANQQVIFIGDQSTAALTLSVPSGDITVTNTAPLHMTATLQDKNGNPLKDKEITFSVPNDVASRFSISNSGKGMTDSNGTAIASLTGTLAGTHMITARLANSNVSDTQPMTFVADKDRAVVVLQTSKAEIIGNGVDETTLTATVKDPFDNVVKNLSVVFRTSPADTQLSLNARNTNENGIAEVTLKGTVLGVHTAEAILLNGKSDTKIVNIVPDTSNAQVTLNIPAQQVVTNNSDSVQLTATVKDPSNHPVAGITVNFTMPQDVAANFTLENNGIAITQANGEAHVTLKGKKAGTHTVTATLGNNNASDAQPVTFVADTATLASLTSVYSFVVSTTEGATMTASVTDANGNPVEGIKVNFRGTSVTISSTSVETDDQGFAEILVTSTEVGLKTVSASLADKPTEVISRLLNAKADINSATITSLEIPEGQVMVAQDVAVKAHVNDQFGNPVAHQPVTFSAEPPEHMTISQNIVSTDTHGIAEVSMTPERNGSYMVKASLANGASLEKQLEAIDEKLTLTASSPLIGVYAPTGATLTATLTSANGTPVEGQVINFSVTPEGATLSGGKVRTNSSGQAPVVLTSNKVGTYTVTASFHNGVTIQTQTTVKVTGNSSTAHVASFIADPSTIAATNTDLSTLKATVEDGSSNLIEGLTVYFALKSGSATLTSLTAVTDQNGIATTSVKGAMTGSVTVSAVTTAGGMQTVDITLVAGPADTSQSVLKSNRSSLKGDYTDSAELRLVLHDISGNPIKVSEGMEFVQSGTNVPYIKISAIDYSLNINGDYKATVTGGGEGIATLIPVLNGVHQAGLSTTIQFTRAEDKIMSGTVSVNGTDLPTTTFPSQGFTGAYYQLNNDNFAPGKTAADYEFSSSASWVDVDATGKVTFKNVGSNWERITATPKSGGPSYVYEIRVKSWWVNAGEAFMIYSLAENFCSSNGYTLPRANYLNHSSSRGIGSLYSEWGDMGHYTTEAGFQSNMYWSSSPANSNEQYVVSLATGDQSVFEKLGFAYATCYKNL